MSKKKKTPSTPEEHQASLEERVTAIEKFLSEHFGRPGCPCPPEDDDDAGCESGPA